MRKLLLVIGAVAVAAASAAVGWFGVRLFINPDEPAASPSPTVSPTPSTDTVSLTFDLAQIEAEAAGLFVPPVCGESWTAPAHSAHGIVPTVQVGEPQDGAASATVAFGTEADHAVAFLGQQGQIIVTRDDVVVTPDWGSEFVPDLYTADPSGTGSASQSIAITGPALCDVAAELAALWDDFDWDTATDEDINAQYQQAAEFEEANATLPPGEYKVYAWTPVILGDHAAIAITLAEEGITDLAHLQYAAGYSPLAGDPRIEPYCRSETTDDGEIDSQCDIPQDVLSEVLRRDVPSEYIVDAPPEVAMSEAATFTIE